MSVVWFRGYEQVGPRVGVGVGISNNDGFGCFELGVGGDEVDEGGVGGGRGLVRGYGDVGRSVFDGFDGGGNSFGELV